MGETNPAEVVGGGCSGGETEFAGEPRMVPTPLRGSSLQPDDLDSTVADCVRAKRAWWVCCTWACACEPAVDSPQAAATAAASDVALRSWSWSTDKSDNGGETSNGESGE